jgi:hypothetical protein
MSKRTESCARLEWLLHKGFNHPVHWDHWGHAEDASLLALVVGTVMPCKEVIAIFAAKSNCLERNRNSWASYIHS